MEYREHTLAALIGPSGELAMGCHSPEDEDWAFLYDYTEDWDCELQDIRRASVTVRVPILGAPELVKLNATEATPNSGEAAGA